ncbi:MAG: hypothetical protein II454_00400 [Bacteroidales bacterium]|nr:hypothetical protein [Bacteroidales bacterium]
MENNKTQEQVINNLAELAIRAVEKDTMSVAEKYARKFGTTDGEATDKEIEELMKRF